MKVYSRFDGSILGEAEGTCEEKMDHNNKKPVSPMKCGKILKESLENLRKNRDMINIYSHETGKTIKSCQSEIDRAILYMEVTGLGSIYRKFGDRSVHSGSYRKEKFSFIDPSMPIFSMIHEIISNLMDGYRSGIVHPENAPLTSMYLSQEISEKYPVFESIITDMVENDGCLEKNIQMKDGEFTAWGNNKRMGFLEEKYPFKFSRIRTDNFPVVIRAYSEIAPAVERIMDISLNSISNSGLRGQIYMIPDKEFVFFKNRVGEMVKRRIENSFGPESSHNYFLNREDTEDTKSEVEKLLNSGWDYMDELPPTVHIITDQYSEEGTSLKEVDGPVIEIMHYGSLADCAKRLEKLQFSDRIDFTGDSSNDFEYLTEYFGSGKKIIRGKTLNEIVYDFIL